MCACCSAGPAMFQLRFDLRICSFLILQLKSATQPVPDSIANARPKILYHQYFITFAAFNKLLVWLKRKFL